MASRHPKWHIEIPTVPFVKGSNLRYAIIESKEDMEHLFMEVKTGEYNNYSARPDLELWIVGKGAKLQTKKEATAIAESGVTLGKGSIHAGAGEKRKYIILGRSLEAPGLCFLRGAHSVGPR